MRPRSQSRGDEAVTVSAERPRLVLPGLIPADPRLERYRVHPGAVTALELDAGDELTVIDTEGRQRGELTVLARGSEDYAPLGAAPDTAASVLRGLAAGGPAAEPAWDGGMGPLLTGADVTAALAARGLDPAAARAVGLFGDWSPAGASAVFAAQQPVTAVVAAPGGLMALDATTTRNLMGSAYPQPGLFGKFYDQDMRPLVEVVRDTVGRHDTFALACNAKYYEDLGYPGHVNCTDNFNGQLARFGIAARRGWPALNFFYNTFFNDANQLFFDEPWSAPGDYVLRS